jgi:hypothetical protein
MTQTWRKALRAWAAGAAAHFLARPGVLGAAIGGSLARGQEWRHSDLELGVLVEERDPGLSYFNIYHERGVEAIQLVRGDLEEQVRLAEQGNLAPVAGWPIQLWECRVVSDPTGLLGRFKRQFDRGLFAPAVVEQKLASLRAGIDHLLGEARRLLAEERPRAALAQARLAMNEAIQAVHWANGTLPRSQNRTDSRLRLLCRRAGIVPFYELYRDAFGLADTQKAVKTYWPRVKEQALDITSAWGGDSTREFFRLAVDSGFAWRQNAGILTVYRLYVPVLGAPEKGIYTRLDDPAWAGQNQDLLRFLGLAGAGRETVAGLVERIAAGRKYYCQST